MIWSRGFVLPISVLLFLTALSPMVYNSVSLAVDSSDNAMNNSISRVVSKKLFTRSFYERCRYRLERQLQGFLGEFGRKHGFIRSNNRRSEDEHWDIVVPDNYSSIQEAVDAAGPMEGYRIFVRNGVYYENVVIDKDGVVLHGESVEGTVIDGSGKGCVIYVSSSYNNVSGFTIQGSGTKSAGIKLDVSSGNQIHHNMITGNAGSGLWLYRSHANTIKDNLIIGNDEHGIFANFSSLTNIFIANELKDNQLSGILLDEISRSNLIAGNDIESNGVGIEITGVSEGNIVHHNNFINNKNNAYDSSSNTWDDGVGEGNYWDDYAGSDVDGDGIGDTPYNVPGGDSVDRFPLMNPPLMQTFSFSEQPAITHKIYGRNPLGSSLGEVIVVPDDYPSIQEAVDHAVDGDTILVKPGVYFENVVVNKTLSIVGDDAENTVVDGGGVGHVFTVVADGCNLSGFTMRNTSMGFAGVKVKSNQVVVRGNIIRDVGDGVNLAGSCGSVVEDNVISGCNFGVYCDGFTNGWVVDNTITSNNDGVAMWMSSSIVFEGNTMGNNSYDGVLLLWCGGNELGGNSIVGSGDFGVEMFSSYGNVVEGNNVKNNHRDGVSLHGSVNNSIKNNVVVNNIGGGISLFFYSNGNNVSGNEVISNFFYGVYLVLSNENIISGNIITNTSLLSLGIFLGDSCNNTISGNTITNTIGISLSSVGIFLSDSCNNTISGNTIKDTIVAGIPVPVPFGFACGILLVDSCNNVVSDNAIVNTTSVGILRAVGLACGIYLLGSCNNVVSDNVIVNTTGVGILRAVGSACGIHLSDSCSSMISGNIITNTRGILGEAVGIYLFDSCSSNMVSGNIITNTRAILREIPGAVGIYLFYSCSSNMVLGNTITNTTGITSSFGISLMLFCDNNTFSGNTITDTRGLLAFGICLPACSDNIVFHNNLMENRFNAYDRGSNQWDNGYPSGGNYWDDYTGSDADGDGIGDTPYRILGGNVDRYPLMKPWSGG